jgi:predicted ATP-grasp superfamily ATP-dependent carboligase
VDALVRRLGWCGIFELELLELRSGGFVPIDFNPRPFGWMTLAVRAGANLPAIWLECLCGAEPKRSIASAGFRYRWEEGDLRHLLWQLRRGRLRAAVVLAPRRRVVHAHFELRDPAPLAAEALDVARRGLRRSVTMRVRARGGAVREHVV